MKGRRRLPETGSRSTDLGLVMHLNDERESLDGNVRAPVANACDKEIAMKRTSVESLRGAIEGLLNAKLCDAIARPDGVTRLVAHRCSGVASRDIRNAQQILQQSLEATPLTRGRQLMN
jgi:hypothetical protein